MACLLLPAFIMEAEVGRQPHLASRPVAVHHRGRLCALSPQAEGAGLRLGQASGQAAAICPEVALLAYDANHYAVSQERVLARCAEYVPAIEPASLTDLFFDFTRVPLAREVLHDLTDAVQALGFTGRAGAGASKLVAKVAALERTGVVVTCGEEAHFLAPLSIARLWPLEEKVQMRLADLGLSTIGQLQRLPVATVARHFGAQAMRLRELARGVDRAPVHPVYPPASVEARAALPEATEAREVIEEMLRALTAQVAAELQRRRQTCRRLALRVEMETRACSHRRTLSHPTAGAAELLLAAQHLLARAEPGPVAALRLRASELSRRIEVQLSLTEAREAAPQAREDLVQAMALVRQEFGERSARWARECELPRRERVLTCWQERGR